MRTCLSVPAKRNELFPFRSSGPRPIITEVYPAAGEWLEKIISMESIAAALPFPGERRRGPTDPASWALQRMGLREIALVGPFLPGTAGEIGRGLPFAVPFGAVTLACAVLIHSGMRRRSLRGQITGLGLAALACAFYTATGFDRLHDQYATERPFAREVEARFPGVERAYFRIGRNPIRYYAGDGPSAESPAELLDFLDARRAPLLVVCAEGELKKLEDASQIEITELFRAFSPPFSTLVKSKPTYVLLSCRRRPSGNQ